MLNTLKYIKKKLKIDKSFFIIVLTLISIRWSFADHYRVPTGSMLPTIQIGDHVLVNKMAYDLKLPFTDIVIKKTNDPQSGEIIVFKYPEDPSINFVKRLVATPGDHVKIENGFLEINGKLTLKLPEKLKRHFQKLSQSNGPFFYEEEIGGKTFKVQRLPHYGKEQSFDFIVPKDQYFFMGDNRDNSADSRSWGFVPRKNLKGRVKNVTMSVSFDNFIPKFNFHRFGKKLI